jgi:endoglucanase
MKLPLPGCLRWLLLLDLAVCCSLLGADAAPAAGSAAPARIYTFRRGVNISHWLSQNEGERTYAAPWFGEKDVAWIAAQGFDHIRFPIDGRLWLRPDGSLNEPAIVPFDAAMQWTRTRGLGVILDMHFLPGASFDPQHQENSLFTDEARLQRVADFWRRVAERYAGEGPWLRFELLNEPVAETSGQLNAFARRMLAAIRPSNPTRIVYLTSNRWSVFATAPELEVPADPCVAFTFHTYEPLLFTHQRASWVEFPRDMPAVHFPGNVPDLSKFVPQSHHAWLPPGTELSAETQIDPLFARLAAWVQAHAGGREIHVGEFGVYVAADAASKRHYIAAVRAAAERYGFGWAVWDYDDSFGVRDRRGKPTPILDGLFPR